MSNDQSVNTGQCSEWGAGARLALPPRCHCSFFVRHWSVQEGEGQSPIAGQRTGGFDADGNLAPARSVGDGRALRIAYETGRVNTGDRDGNPHDRIRSVQMRLRIERTNGSAANQALLINPERSFNAVRLMDRWLDRIAGDTSGDGPQRKAARNKPEGLEDSCWGPNEEKVSEPASNDGPGRCNELYPAFGDPRIAAGAPVIGEILKCTLKPVEPKDYKQPLTDAQLARLKHIFPQGTCDFSRPGVGQTNLGKTWIAYGDR